MTPPRPRRASPGHAARRVAWRTGAIAFAAALACSAALAQTATTEAPAPRERQGLRVDDRRPDDPLTVDLLGQPVELGGSWDYTDEVRRDFDLTRAEKRNRRVREHEVKLEARTRPGAKTEVFVQAVGLYELRRTQGTPRTRNEKSLERGQAWVRFEDLRGSGWDLQAGRVPLIERRAWWWDDDLDAVRLTGRGDGWRLDSGLGRELMRVSSAERGLHPTQRGVQRWFGQATWQYEQRQQIDAFWLVQRDALRTDAPGAVLIDEDATDPSDLRGAWFGLRASGEIRPKDAPRLAWWLDTAWLRAKESLTGYDEQDDGSFVAGDTARRRVRGHAFDLGATVTMPWTLRPSLTAGYARGSGGQRSASRDDNFRQTGLQENKARLGGVKRLQRYGELLQPELSNLQVTTLGTGLRLLDKSSIELIWHRYRQPVASELLGGSRLSADPLGLDGDIGREIDIVLALREWQHVDLILRWSRFTPGRAFAEDERDPAQSFEINATLNF